MNGSALRPAHGFTLLEVMLAFVLLAGAMGLLIGMLSGGLRQVNDGRSETEAALYAQSLLDELGVLAPIRPGRSAGQFGDGRYDYTLEISESRDPVPRPAPEPGALTTADAAAPVLPTPFGDRPAVLYRIVLNVHWGSGGPGQSLAITTLRYRIPALDDGAGR